MENTHLNNLNENELLELIGYDLLQQRKEMLPFGKEKAIEIARKWVEVKLSIFKEKICNDMNIHAKIESDIYILATAVSDLIASVCFGVSPITVAYLLIKKGLKNLCNEI